jgi:hypothetical protein
MARQIFAQGETYLQAQLQLALASDQRATTMASILTAVASAVAAGALALWTVSQNASILAAGLVTATVLLVGAAFAAWAARPVDFNLAGNHPEKWFGVSKAPLVVVLGGEAENYQEHIEANDKVLGANQRALKRAGIAALLAPLVGVAAWVLTLTCPFFRVEISLGVQPLSSSGGLLHIQV